MERLQIILSRSAMLPLFRAVCFASCLVAAPALAQPTPTAVAAPPAPSRTNVISLWPSDAVAPTSRFEIWGGLAGSAYSIHLVSTSLRAREQLGDSGSADVGALGYLTPVVDSSVARSLQPFLQRASSVYGRVSGGGFSTTYEAATGMHTRNYSYVEASAGVDAYLTSYFALTARLGYGYDVLHDKPTLEKGQSLFGGAGVGLRFGDARIDAAYAFDARGLDGAFVAQRWGEVKLTAKLVLAQSFALTAAAHVDDGGGGGSLDLAGYPTRDLALFIGGSGETFVYVDDGVRADQYTISAGTSYWLGRALRLSLGYEFRVFDLPAQPHHPFGTQQAEHAFSISAVARLP
jgi:hypothetical protein